MKRPSRLLLVLLCLAVTPLFGQSSGWSELDLVGAPDLIVDSKMLGSQWVVRDELLGANFCSVIEGDVMPAPARPLYGHDSECRRCRSVRRRSE
jgi:hypothetical protein